MLEKLYRRYRYGDVSWTPPLSERVMRTYDAAKIRAGSAKRGVALGFLLIGAVLLGGYGLLQCARDQGKTTVKPKPGTTQPATKPAPQKRPAQVKRAPAPAPLADQIFRGHSPN